MNDDRAERCATCRFWRPFFNGDTDDALREEIEPHGRCRRYPPAAVTPEPYDLQDAPTQFWLQPATWPEDWCGEWQDKAPPAKPEPSPYPSWEEFTRGRGKKPSNRVVHLLERMDPQITSVEFLVTQSEADLCKRRGIWHAGVWEIRRRLAEFGLRLRGDEFSPARS